MLCEVGSLVSESGAVGAMPKEERPILKVSVNATLFGCDGGWLKRGGETLFVANSGLLAGGIRGSMDMTSYHSTSPV